jgi:hypothetical protein
VFAGAEIERIGFPWHPLQRRPARRSGRQRHRLPRADGPRRHVGPRSRGAHRRRDRRELRAIGANLTGAVCINLLRHPAWGRAQETYGEDPFHVGELGAALTRGLQRHVMACVKHFACNSMENARFSVDIEVDDVALHEVYLPHFRRVVDEGVASVMSAYNSVNGEWCGQSHAAHRRAARRVGLRGVRDQRLDLRPARRAGVGAAGLDIEMPYRMIRHQQSVPGALERGELEWADVDRAAERLIATLLRFDDVLSAPTPSADVLGRRSTVHWLARWRLARWCCCATSRCRVRRCCRSHRMSRSRSSASWRTP